MSEENSRIPSWLRDTKKRLIIIIVIVCAFLSGMNYSIEIKNLYAKDGENESNVIVSAVENIAKPRGIEPGTYMSDSGMEGFSFDSNGMVIYEYGGYQTIGTYEVSKDKELVIEMEGSEFRFQIEENTKDQIVLNNGSASYVFYRIAE